MSPPSPPEARMEPAPEHRASPQRCGTVAIVGKPNVGKSTLINALVGAKISITSRKAQTTRHRITGIVTQGPEQTNTQFVFVDLPGFQTRHGTALHRAMNRTVQGAIADVDLVLFVLEAGKYSIDDAKVLDLIPPNLPCLLVANKLDRAGDRQRVAHWMREMSERRDFLAFFPMSAKSKADVQRLLEVCAKHLPEQAWIYGEDELTDRTERFQVGEVVREKLFRLTGDELPYTSTVVVDEFKEEPGKTVGRFVRLAATIIVERDGHKAMVIGEGGERLKRIGTEARADLEKLLDAKVFLQLWVKVKSGWADDEARVRAFGYE